MDWKITSMDGQQVRASNGRLVPVEGDLTSAADCKTVFVLASFDPQRSLRERQVVRWLKRIAKFGVEIGGGENGSLVLAPAGLLHRHPVAPPLDTTTRFHEHYPQTPPAPHLHSRPA